MLFFAWSAFAMHALCMVFLEFENSQLILIDRFAYLSLGEIVDITLSLSLSFANAYILDIISISLVLHCLIFYSVFKVLSHSLSYT